MLGNSKSPPNLTQAPPLDADANPITIPPASNSTMTTKRRKLETGLHSVASPGHAAADQDNSNIQVLPRMAEDERAPSPLPGQDVAFERSSAVDAAFEELPPRRTRLKPVNYSTSYVNYIEPSVDSVRRRRITLPLRRNLDAPVLRGTSSRPLRSTRYTGRLLDWDSEEDNMDKFAMSSRDTRKSSSRGDGYYASTSSNRVGTRSNSVAVDNHDDDDGPVLRRRSLRASSRTSNHSIHDETDHEDDVELGGHHHSNGQDPKDQGDEDMEEDTTGYKLRSRGKKSRLIRYAGDEGRSAGHYDEEDDESARKSYGLRPRTEPKNYQVRIPLYGASPKKTERRRPFFNRPVRRPGANMRHLFSNPFSAALGGSQIESSDDEHRTENRRNHSSSGSLVSIRPLNYAAFDSINSEKLILNQASNGGQTLTDTDPLGVDHSIDFSAVGGLDGHIKSLKEMVLLPLLYPEVFTKFAISPPRGVIFHGPPGTGKTLVARALANVCSNESQKVAFFMRKGADVLSKWVGESERQLKALFEQAKLMQPAIIFFDEIDGLAPVRSAKQDQIHSSIVTTLLALMDGLESRGQVVVIGATNRLDSIDPALRRPGRFDRELLFPLPDRESRKVIIDIHTKRWEPSLDNSLKEFLADSTQGFGGSDIKALVTEAALHSLDRTYPQVYTSE
eukprot:Partr_v1_DN28775_c0_g1_i1_m62286 putative ATPase family, AAA domain containing